MTSTNSLNLPSARIAGPAADGSRDPRIGVPALAQARGKVGDTMQGITGVYDPAPAAAARQADATGRPLAADDPRLDEAIEQLNAQAGSLNRSLRFTVDEDTGQTVVKVVDRETEKVIRQIPPEYTMEILRRLDIGGGLLLEEEA